MALLYGSTYQQFRFFSLAAPGGATDAIQYIEMSHGNPDIDSHVRYRWPTPFAARMVSPALEKLVNDHELAVRLSFYCVNFAFSLIACVAFFGLLRALEFPLVLSLLGVSAFASSRITVLVTGTPMVDAGYYCAISVLLYLVVARKAGILAVMLPLMVLCKETIWPFLFLPLLTPMRRSPAYGAGLLGAALAFAISRHVVDILYPVNLSTLADEVAEHLAGVPENLALLLTLGGLHDLQNGFSLLLPLALAGALINARRRRYAIPRVVLASVPIGLGLAVLSGNLGRMFFAAYPAVIALALITIDHVARADARVNGHPPG